MKLDHSLISRIQQANDIVDVISEHVNLVRKGCELAGLCPFHDDHKPSMYVNPDKQIFKCFACGAGGDVIKFVQMREGLTFIRAVERLAERASISLDMRGFRKQDTAPEADPAVIAKVNKWVLAHWQRNLADEHIGKSCRDYIESRRIPPQVANDFKFGFAQDKWDDVLEAAKKANINEKLLLAAGLIVKNEQGRSYDKFRNRLMFPIIDASSRVIAFGGRTLGDDPAKYMNSPATVLFDKSNSVYGLDKARHSLVSSSTAVIVEGYTDVVMAHRFGCKNVVATLGTSLTAGHAKLLRRYAKDIVLIFDSDIAGAAAAERALKICLAEKIDIRLASVPQGKDPCDYLLAKGGDEFNKLIENATEVMQYCWQRLGAKFESSDNLTDRKNATENFLKIVSSSLAAGSVDAITQGLIINRLSRILQLSADDIRRELQKRTASQNRGRINTIANAKVVKNPKPKGFGSKAQQEIIEAVLNEPRLFETAVKQVSADDFDDEQLKQIWLLLKDNIVVGREFSLASLLASVESSQIAERLVALSDNGQDNETLRKRLNGAIKALNEYKQRQQMAGSDSMDDEHLRRLTQLKSSPDRRNPGFLPI